MQTAKLNTILANGNRECRDLSNIDIIIIASAMVKVWKESNMNNPVPSCSFINLETRKNQYIKIFTNIIGELKGINNLDNMFDLITGLTDNFNFFNNLQLGEIHLNNIGNFNNLDINDLSNLFNIKLSSLNKFLYEKTYIFFKNYFDNDEQQNISNTNDYVNFLNENLKLNLMSKSELASIFLGLQTFSKISTNNVNANINKEKIIENLGLVYHISTNNILKFINKIFLKISTNETVNVNNEIINYKLVYEVMNWCI
jgi:hypothetical protein